MKAFGVFPLAHMLVGWMDISFAIISTNMGRIIFFCSIEINIIASPIFNTPQPSSSIAINSPVMYVNPRLKDIEGAFFVEGIKFSPQMNSSSILISTSSFLFALGGESLHTDKPFP